MISLPSEAPAGGLVPSHQLPTTGGWLPGGTLWIAVAAIAIAIASGAFLLFGGGDGSAVPASGGEEGGVPGTAPPATEETTATESAEATEASATEPARRSTAR